MPENNKNRFESAIQRCYCLHCVTRATIKIISPVVIAIPETNWINSWISRDMGVGPESTPDVKEAIRPITVLSPVLITTPRAIPLKFQSINKLLFVLNWNLLPSTALDEKKAKFFVSSGLSCVHSGDRDCGSDSPVKDELSTLKLLQDNTRMSAGSRSPNFTSITSPTTKSSTLIVNFSPSLTHSANYKKRNSFQFTVALFQWKHFDFDRLVVSCF